MHWRRKWQSDSRPLAWLLVAALVVTAVTLMVVAGR